MCRTVKRAYRYRFYPTPDQADLLVRTFGCVRKVWNMALAERTRRYKDEGASTTYVDTAAWLTAWKRDPELVYLTEVSNVPLQQTLRHQQKAFSAFFAKAARYPKFKSKKNPARSATFASNAFTFKGGQLTLAKMSEPLDIAWSRPLPQGAEPSTVTVSIDAAGRWHISILVEEVIEPLPKVDGQVGMDAGLTSLAALSTGEKITNPRHERADRRKLAKAQRELSRKTEGSANWRKQKAKVARVYARITDRRRDHLHKVSTRLIRENQVVAIEDLNVRNMVKNRRLARAISDAAWSDLRSMLEYKADWYGRDLVVVDRWLPTTRMCSGHGCAHIAPKMDLSIREWRCPSCHTRHDRDINAAKNILAAGLAER